MKHVIMWELEKWLSTWEGKEADNWVESLPQRGQWTANQSPDAVYSVTKWENGDYTRYYSLNRILGNAGGSFQDLKRELRIEHMDDEKALRKIANDFYSVIGDEYRHIATCGAITKMKFLDFCRTGILKMDGKVIAEMPPLGPDDMGNWLLNAFDTVESIARSSIRGGLTIAFRHSPCQLAEIYDIRSSYPYIMTLELPYGDFLTEPPEERHTSLIYPVCDMALKNGKVPCLHWTHPGDQIHYHKYILGSEFPERITLDGSYPIWAEEWELIKCQYEIWHENPSPKTYYIRVRENVYLQKYIETIFNYKNSITKGTMSYRASKVLMNALYGKTIQNPSMEKIKYVDGKRVKYRDPDRGKTWHTAVGSYIVMKGRVRLMETIRHFEKQFLYCDTDSIIIEHTPEERHYQIPYDDGALGKWEYQGLYSVNIVGPKCYQEMDKDGKITAHVAGLPDKIAMAIPFGELAYGFTCKIKKNFRHKETLQIEEKEIDFTVVYK